MRSFLIGFTLGLAELLVLVVLGLVMTAPEDWSVHMFVFVAVVSSAAWFAGYSCCATILIGKG